MMKFKAFTFIPFVLFTGALVSHSNPAQATCSPPTFSAAEQEIVPTEDIDQILLSKAITEQTNYYRCINGLTPLSFDPNLKSAAEIQARNMAHLNRLAHVLPISGYRNMKQRFRAANVQAFRIRAENVGTEYRLAFGTGAFLVKDAKHCAFTYRASQKPIPRHSYGSLAQSIVKRWWDSYDHRRNILDRRVRRIGAAAKFVSGGNAPCGTYYLAQNFAG